MSQVTIYLDAETERLMTAKATAMGLSKSKWIAQAIRSHLDNDWPPAVRDLSGSWADFPSAETLRATLSADTERESF